MKKNSPEIQWLLQEKYHGQPNEKFLQDVKRLAAGEPVDYLIGHRPFLGCTIDLSQRPLIPRPETEFWVAEAIKGIKPGARVLDVFAGSGCIGLAVLKKVKNSQVTFAEKDKKALAQIRINLKLNRLVPKRCKVVASDIFSGVRGKFDIIFANPPYIPQTRRHKVQASVLRYEPRAALFGGANGLRYINRFLAKAKTFLLPGGKIYLEFDSPQKKEIEHLLKKYAYQGWQFHRDQYQKWRWVIIE